MRIKLIYIYNLQNHITNFRNYSFTSATMSTSLPTVLYPYFVWHPCSQLEPYGDGYAIKWVAESITYGEKIKNIRGMHIEYLQIIDPKLHVVITTKVGRDPQSKYNSLTESMGETVAKD